MKNLIIKKKIFNMNDAFTIYDHNDNILFETKNEGDIRNSVYTLVDPSSGSKTRIYKEIEKKSILYHIDIKGDKIVTITTNKGLRTKRFSVEPGGLTIKANSSKLIFKLRDGSEELGRVETKLLRFKDTYFVDILNPSEETMYILIALAIIIDERDPSFIGGIFKNIESILP
ncbi:MAG TPA: hypothetical protein VK093_00080 [Candidatus Avipropionibacterium sp.]|nr:hypothetical protein [Candidatus Avipropionibacterium sp.]